MNLLTILIILSLIAAIVSLGWGISSMAHGGEFDSKHSADFMGARVGFQGLAVVLIVLALIVALI